MNEKALSELMIGNKKRTNFQPMKKMNPGLLTSINQAGLASAMGLPRQKVVRYPKNTTQKQYLRQIKKRHPIIRFPSYYTDVDGDRVVNAMDCYPFDGSRHGFFGDAWKKAKGYFKGQNENESEQENTDQSEKIKTYGGYVKIKDNSDSYYNKEYATENGAQKNGAKKIDEEELKRAEIEYEKGLGEEQIKRQRELRAEQIKSQQEQREEADEKIREENLRRQKQNKENREDSMFQRYKETGFKNYESPHKTAARHKSRINEAKVNIPVMEARLHNEKIRQDEINDKYEEVIKQYENAENKTDKKKLKEQLKELEKTTTKNYERISALNMDKLGEEQDIRIGEKYRKTFPKQKYGAFGSFKESIIEDIGFGIGKVKRAKAKIMGYRTYEPEQREEQKVKEVIRAKEHLEAQIEKTESLTRASMAGLPEKQQSAMDKSINKLRDRYKHEEISDKDYLKALEKQHGWIQNKAELEKKSILGELSLKDKETATKKTQLKHQDEYAKLQIAMSKENIGLTRIKAQSERARAGLGIAQAGTEMERIRQYKQAQMGGSFGGLSGFMITGQQERPMPGWGQNDKPSATGGETSAMIGNIIPYEPKYIPKPVSLGQPTGRFDPEAPKFVYRKKAGAFTRKSTRVTAEEKGTLMPGMVSQPSTKKRAGSMYPWTKPMKGWERIYAGKGKHIKKGRPKKGKSKFGVTATKPPKMPFSPFVSTYGITLPKIKKQKTTRTKSFI